MQTPKLSVMLQYRGNATDRFVKQLKQSVSIQPILTLRKLKTVLPSLKATTKRELRSRVIYKISCPSCNACYVGQTRRHLLTRFREHRNNRNGSVYNHFNTCISGKPTLNDIEIIASSIRETNYLLTLEALFIRQLKPELNTKDEFRSRELIIKV